LQIFPSVKADEPPVAAMSEFTFSPAKECGASKATIEAFAARFAQSVGYGPGDDLDPIVRRLGGKIAYRSFADLGDSSHASVRVWKEGDFEIVLPDYTNAARDRFSIAHEIGHYVLHYPLVKGPMVAARYGSTRVEWEANWFAAGFLMPEEAFRKQFAARKDPQAVATFFKVSNAAAMARVKALQLI
jgi:Zn-dependent peptidase ImmA (M78 family)